MIMLTTQQIVEQLRLYAESNDSLGNSERAHALNFAADFIETYHPDMLPKCEVSGCNNLAEYEGWYRCKDTFLGTPTGLIQK